MASTVPTLIDDPLKRLNIDKDATLIDNLVKALLFGRDKSNEEMAKAIAGRKPDGCAQILPTDVAHIYRFLMANLDYDKNTYKKWAKVKVKDKFGDKNKEVQESLREWVVDIQRANKVEN